MKRIFEKAFKPPFRTDKHGSWFYDSKDNFCFQLTTYSEDGYEIRKEVCDIINGKISNMKYKEVTYNKPQGTIESKGKPILLIRGWGYLTGGGGLNLSENEAQEIQDDLANYIVDNLSQPF